MRECGLGQEVRSAKVCVQDVVKEHRCCEKGRVGESDAGVVNCFSGVKTSVRRIYHWKTDSIFTKTATKEENII